MKYTLEELKNLKSDMINFAASRYDLQFVKEQDKEICLAAVKRNGFALKYVEKQDKDICLAAVKQNPKAIMYIRDQSPEMCAVTVQINELAFIYIYINPKNQTDFTQKLAVGYDYLNLRLIPENKRKEYIQYVNRDDYDKATAML